MAHGFSVLTALFDETFEKVAHLNRAHMLAAQGLRVLE